MEKTEIGSWVHIGVCDRTRLGPGGVLCHKDTRIVRQWHCPIFRLQHEAHDLGGSCLNGLSVRVADLNWDSQEC